MNQFKQFVIKNAIQNILMKLILLLVSIGIIEFVCQKVRFSNVYFQWLAVLGSLFVLGYFVFYYDSSNNKLKKYFLFLPDADFHSIPVYAGLFVIIRMFVSWKSSLLIYLLYIVIMMIIWNIHFLKKSTERQQGDPLVKDIPIGPKEPDELGRTAFINTVAQIIQLCGGRGNRLLLDGDWGSGKTSVVNCVEALIKETKTEKLYHFARVNPWSNETRAKFVESLLGVIDEFCRGTQPSFAVSKVLFNNLLANVASFSAGYFGFQFGQQKENLDSEIEELSQKLAYKKEKLVLVIDDLDRLTKTQILDILSVIYLFSACNNIIFLLLANSVKVNEILVESKNACIENLEYMPKGATSYEGYLQKMCSNEIRLPEVLPEFLKKACLLRMKKILDEQKVAPLSLDEEQSIPVGCFNNMRTIKRVLQSFLNTLLQPKVRGEVYPFHLFLLTILSVQYPKVYEAIRDRVSMWEDRNILNWSDDLLSEYKEYFDFLFNMYPTERVNLTIIFFILNPNYRNYLLHLGINDKNMDGFVADLSLQYPISLAKNIDKAFYNARYTNRYFCMNFSSDIIPDSLLDKEFEDTLKLPSVESGTKRLLAFIKRHQSRINSFFSYISNKKPALDHKILLMILNALSSLVNSLHKEINRKQYIIEEMVKITEAEKFSQLEITAVVERIQSLCDKYLFYRKYKNGHESAFIKNILQAQSTSAETVLQEAYQNRMPRFVFSWERKFEYYVKPDEERTQAITEILKQNEEYFLFLYGNNLLEQILAGVKLELPLPVKTLLDITTALLKREDLAHQEDLLRLQSALQKYQ